MTTLTYTPTAIRADEAVAPKAGHTLSSRLSGFVQAIVDAKARKAQAQVDGYLASLNDETLLDLGLDPASVRHGNPLVRFHI
jgi:hypothetical protein